MGRCGELVWTHRLNNWAISSLEAKHLRSKISYMCGKNANGIDYCHAVSQGLVGGQYLESDSQEVNKCQ